MISRALRALSDRAWAFADSFGDGNITEFHLVAFYVAGALDVAASRLRRREEVNVS